MYLLYLDQCLSGENIYGPAFRMELNLMAACLEVLFAEHTCSIHLMIMPPTVRMTCLSLCMTTISTHPTSLRPFYCVIYTDGEI